MNWNDLASSELPSLSGYPPVTSNLLQFQLSNDNSSNVQASATTNSLEGLSTAFRQPNPTFVSQPTPSNAADAFASPIESMDDMIRRYEQKLFSSMIQRCTDETRHKTAQAVDAQLQQQWEKERAMFTKRSRGEGIGKKNQELSSSSPFLSINNSIGSSEKPDPVFTIAHLRIVERIGRISVVDSVEQFSQLASNMSRQNNNLTSLMAYESAWQLVANLIGVRNSPIDQARGILTHFCKQFQVNVINRVRQASLMGQNTNSIYANDLTAQCEIFARLTIGNTDPWIVCFFCLRCGDANAALYALEQVPQLDEAVRRLLIAMARTQGKLTCLWDGQASILRLDRSDRNDVDNLLEAADGRDVSTSDYEKAVLLLLSGNKPWPFNFEPTEGRQTIEDYLTGALWVAALQINPIDHLIQVGEEILKRGPSYFDDPSSGGWSYALPLLATQQYQKALLWLVQSGGPMGLLYAVHIGLVMSSDGIPIRNLGQTDPIASETTTNLLLEYSNNILKEHGSLAAFDYLIHIPNKVRAFKEIATLIATINDDSAVVGTLSSEGIRQGGVLSKYFNNDEICRILIETSELLSLSTGDRHKQGRAVMCLMLAGRYDDALSMLNRLIAPPNIVDDNRYFWLEQVTLFHTHYTNRRTHVLDVLERNNKTSVIRTSRLLLDLNLFFDRLRKSDNSSECLVIAKKTQLLPEIESDLKIKESEFQDLDPLVKDSIPFLLIEVMEILKGEHTNLKRDIHRDTSGMVRARLKELNENARLLTSFASRLGIASRHIIILTHLMSLMI